MSRRQTGAEFIERAARRLSVELHHPELVAMLYEAGGHDKKRSSFGELAFQAKSYQKVRKLLSSGRADEATTRRAEDELSSIVSNFAAILKETVSQFPEGQRNSIVEKYLRRSSESFENLVTLLEDFAIIKDFMLDERDSGKPE